MKEIGSHSLHDMCPQLVSEFSTNILSCLIINEKDKLVFIIMTMHDLKLIVDYPSPRLRPTFYCVLDTLHVWAPAVSSAVNQPAKGRLWRCASARSGLHRGSIPLHPPHSPCFTPSPPHPLSQRGLNPLHTQPFPMINELLSPFPQIINELLSPFPQIINELLSQSPKL